MPGMSYRVIRFYQRAHPSRRTVAYGLTLEEAQKHCSDPETSSSTCTSSDGKRRTRKLGPWFDGYEEAR